MAFLIGGANSAADTGYNIANSCRFGVDTYMHKTPGSAGNRRIFTFSAWFKRDGVTSDYIFGGGTDVSNYTGIGIQLTGGLEKFAFYDRDGDGVILSLRTNALLRDHSAWYHLVVGVDTTQSTDTNRVKFYINGVQMTSFATDTFPDQNDDLYFGQDEIMSVGTIDYSDGTVDYVDGYLAEAVYIDGTQYAASDFGEFDEDSGIWKPKDVSGLTFGTNGFYLDFEDSANLGNDANGGTDLTEVNLAATDQCTDTPTNNFATLNPLNSLNATLSEGNTQLVRTSDTANSVSTICPTGGKWYIEFQNSAAQNSAIGIVNVDAQPAGTNIYPYTYAAAIILETNVLATLLYDEVAADGETSRDTTSNVGTTKIGLAVDLDNQDIYVSTGGQWWGGSSFNQGTGPGTALITDLPTDGFAAGFYINGSLANACYYNFGNPSSADTISSGNADANGYGNFEYAVPSGYYALCTKNLAEFG